jgi:hypothetical protein
MTKVNKIDDQELKTIVDQQKKLNKKNQHWF